LTKTRLFDINDPSPRRVTRRGEELDNRKEYVMEQNEHKRLFKEWAETAPKPDADEIIGVLQRRPALLECEFLAKYVLRRFIECTGDESLCMRALDVLLARKDCTPETIECVIANVKSASVRERAIQAWIDRDDWKIAHFRGKIWIYAEEDGGLFERALQAMIKHEDCTTDDLRYIISESEDASLCEQARELIRKKDEQRHLFLP